MSDTFFPVPSVVAEASHRARCPQGRAWCATSRGTGGKESVNLCEEHRSREEIPEGDSLKSPSSSTDGSEHSSVEEGLPLLPTY